MYVLLSDGLLIHDFEGMFKHNMFGVIHLNYFKCLFKSRLDYIFQQLKYKITLTFSVALQVNLNCNQGPFKLSGSS